MKAPFAKEELNFTSDKMQWIRISDLHGLMNVQSFQTFTDADRPFTRQSSQQTMTKSVNNAPLTYTIVYWVFLL